MKWYIELLILGIIGLVLYAVGKGLWDAGYNLEWMAETAVKAFARIMDYMVTKYVS